MPYFSAKRAANKGPVFWVRESFHPENHLHPLKVQVAYYLMHCIITKLAYGDRESARLKKQYLQTVMGRWQCDAIMSALLDEGLIRRVGNYVQRERSFGYLPGEQFLEHPLRQILPTDVQLLERLRKAHEEKKKPWKPIHRDWNNWQSALGADMDQAYQILARIPATSNPYGMQTMMVKRIHRRNYRLSVDDYGRVHNSITSLHSALRAAVRIKGQPLGCIDIVNAQPALVALLISSTTGGVTHKRPGDGQAKGGPYANGTSIYDRRAFGPTGGLTTYVRLVERGELYEYLVRATGLLRHQVKRSLLRDVFGRNGNYHCELEQIFRNRFPGVWTFIRRFNRDDHGALLRELQRVESDLVIHRVGQRLKQLACRGCVSLHDAVYCARCDIAVVKRAFRDEMGNRLLDVNFPLLLTKCHDRTAGDLG